MADATDFPKMNLARIGAVAVVLGGDLAPEEGDRVLSPDRQDLIGVRKYQRDGTPHACGEFVWRLDDGFVWQVTYQAGSAVPEGNPPQEFLGSGWVLPLLMSRDRPSAVHCHLDFRMVGASDELKASLWLPVPIVVSGPEGGHATPFDEIRGVRGVKRRSGEGEADLPFEFILDSPEDGTTHLSIDFDLNLKIDTGLPELVFRRGRRIARSLGVVQGVDDARQRRVT